MFCWFGGCAFLFYVRCTPGLIISIYRSYYPIILRCRYSSANNECVFFRDRRIRRWLSYGSRTFI